MQLLFHATPTSSAKVVDAAPAVRITAERAGLLIRPRSDKPWTARVVRGDARPQELYWQGFVSGGYAKPLEPTDCAIFEYRGPLPATVATVLYPYPKTGAQEAHVRSLPAVREGKPLGTDRAYGLEVSLSRGRDVVLALAEPGKIADFGEFAFDGRVAVVRHDTADKLTSIAMVDGGMLLLGRQALLDLGGRRAHYVECGPGRGIASDGLAVAGGLRVIDLRWQEQPTTK